MLTDTSNLQKIFKGKVILVTGGTGSIGSEIVRQLLPFEPAQIRIYSRDETKHYFFQKELDAIPHKTEIRPLIGDVRDKERLDMAMGGVDIVFHAAAMKYVSYCEYNPFEAVKTNVHGTQNVIDAAIHRNVEKVVSISTDKAVNPSNIMGVTKLLMEKMIIGANSYIGESRTRFSVVRFGNVLDSRGSVIPLWVHQIKNGGPVTVTDKKMMRFFMTIPNAVNLVFRATASVEGGEIFILKMKEENIYELAQKTIAEYGAGKDIPIEITGAGEGEKFTERLFTDEEKLNMVEEELYYVIKTQRAQPEKPHKNVSK